MTRRWLLALVLSLVPLMGLAGCGLLYDRYDAPPSDEQMRAYAEKYPPKGEPVEFWMYTHCGVEHARIGGKWWLAEPPLYGDAGPAEPPEGWGNPYQKGRLVVFSPSRAVFSARGTDVELVPSQTGEPTRRCA